MICADANCYKNQTLTETNSVVQLYYVKKRVVCSFCARKNKEQVGELSQHEKSSKELHFRTRFPQNEWEQFKACLWKQHLTYWRSPKYNLVRLTFTTLSSLILGALLWQKGQNM